MDDTLSTMVGRKRNPSRRTPFIVTNPDNDSDDDTQQQERYTTPQYKIPPLPSPVSHSPHSEQSSLPSTSYLPSSHVPLNNVATELPNAGQSNPSLSSPSGSSSPAVESTPPPSTPGQTVPPDDGSASTERPCYPVPDERPDIRQHNVGRMSVMDRLKSFPHVLHSKVQSRQAPTPIVTGGAPHASPTREPISSKVLLTVTADCDNFTYLDVTGARDAAMIREKMFSKLQISDDQQPFFSIYRTEIGQFAIGEALSDERLLEICRMEGDSKGTVKFLVQHSSATVHLPPPPPRSLVANHVPPVLPNYQESGFRSPSRRAQSTKSNHETMSSTSEPFVVDQMPGNEGSVSDDLDQHERERNRNTIRPSPQQALHSQYFGSSVPASPRRLGSANIREDSPAGSRRPMSPIRIEVGLGTSSSAATFLPDRSRIGITTPTPPLTFSPSVTYFDDNTILSPSIRKKHTHSASDAAADRERLLEMNERQQQAEREARQGRRDERKQDQGKRRPKATDYPDGSSKRTQEPWVLVPFPATGKNERPSTSEAAARSTSNIPRTGQHASTTPYPATHNLDPGGRYQPYTQGLYSSSRGNLPQVPGPPRGPPPPVPSSNEGARHQRPPGQPVPPNWAIKWVGDKTDQRSLQAKQSRLLGAKSMDNLRINNLSSPSSNASSRKTGQNLTRPSVNGLRDTTSNSSASFMNMDPSPSRRDPQSAGLPKSYDSRNNLSPTTYVPSRSSPMHPSQTQGDFGQSPQSHYRPLPVQGQYMGSGLNYLNTPSQYSASRQSPEDLYPRPRSALDDIGASPAPPRPFRPLPTTGGPSNYMLELEAALDPDDSRSPRVASPHHPYAAPTSQSLRSLPSTSLSQTSGKASSSTLTDSTSPSDTQTVIGDPSSGQNTRGLGILLSPDSPRRTPVDKIDGASQESSDTPKSFVSMTQDSPVYDGDNESSSLTLKRGEHDWISTYLASTSSSEGTVKVSDRSSRGQDKQYADAVPGLGAAPFRLSKEISSSSISTTRSTTATDEGGCESDDDDDVGSLWQPAKHTEPKRPTLSVDTESGKASSMSGMGIISRSSPHLTPAQQKGIPFPPPDFPPPPPPAVRRRRTNGKTGEKGPRSNRESQFIKASQNSAMNRPRPEEITDHLEAYFPDHDVDKPLIDSTSGGSSPTAAEPSGRGFQSSAADKDKKSRHKKSIRLVASEAKKKIDSTLRADASALSSNLRRRNTKLWGGKLEEVTASQVPSVPPVPESPTTLNPKPIFKWVRGELIGKGTYGRVYLALNATTGEMIAVKQVEIPQTDADRDDKRQVSVVEALKLESETLKDLDHPNIVQYLGFEQTPDFLSIFLEYVPGGSVAGCLRKHGKFDDQVSRSFTGQIIAGLEYLHNNGIIHRDLKADNILVDPSGICKISDFGISKRTDDINENGVHTSMQGSVFWMAPEVVQAARKGEKHGYNGKVDIWSLGCVVLEMWAGRRPWQDADAIAVIYELITKQGAPPVPPDVVLGPDADDFRRKCFAIKPDERPSASELRQHPYLNLQPGWTFTGFK
ncbi:uncharacterized protein FOMMEDRAFT_121406 [Fomitiporia mediterranea MF3/22]|uniref:uncharacterized protein n=1 Tax=Fomitiporia mediterranea (strain MF3/22) TaxID=694068 RepID=UPI00044087B6|nr:uncharacterized protein FOMMEDRAFT_121406 [Fomitiporia mediterranea MF3/22]EJD03987.1 hypothetical protein FOMMEDRAFT_121406 [Fomitiporia mediterranea MF3/22]